MRKSPIMPVPLIDSGKALVSPGGPGGGGGSASRPGRGGGAGAACHRGLGAEGLGAKLRHRAVGKVDQVFAALAGAEQCLAQRHRRGKEAAVRGDLVKGAAVGEMEPVERSVCAVE